MLTLNPTPNTSVIEAFRPKAEVENQIKEFKINFDNSSVGVFHRLNCG